MPKLFKSIVFFLVFAAACASGEVRPVPIENGDMCSFCRMAISEKKFAAEIIAVDETVLKFDDIGCLLRYRKAGGDKLQLAAIYFTDYDTRQWIKADSAVFVRSKNIKTPMGSGILAYADRVKAGSDVVTFDALSEPEH